MKKNITKLINWKLFRILLLMVVISILAIMPYAFTLQSDLLARQQLPVPMPVLVLISIVQSIILFSIILFLGLYFAQKVGLGLPYIENYLETKKIQISFKKNAVLGVVSGIIVGFSIIVLDGLFATLGVLIPAGIHPPAWQGLLASLYGGIGEELLLRLFFMSFVVWLFAKIGAQREPKTNVVLMISTIIISALLFGLGHLPAMATLTTLTPIVVIRTLTLNIVGGLVFGWLYWKKGLEIAMISHFFADIILHVVFVSLFI